MIPQLELYMQDLLTWRGALGALYFVLILSVIVVILMENRNPLKAVSWMMILVLLPAVGLVLYVLLGRDNRRKRLMSKHSYERIIEGATPEIPKENSTNGNLPGEYLPVSSLIRLQTGIPVMEADSIVPYLSGREKFEALKRDILAARDHIHLEYYILSDDELGGEIASLLIRKAQERVRVRVIYDYVGSWETSQSFMRKLRKCGVEVYPFLPVIFPFLTSKVNYRNHRKVVVIDGHIGYVGGMNISDKYVVGDELGIWRDTHVRITGPAVNQLQSSFIADWYVASRRILPHKLYYNAELEAAVSHDAHREIPMQIFQTGPTGPWRTLMQVLCLAIYNAEESLWIQTPYFLPNEPLNKAIIGAALRGIDVRIILPEKSDTFGVKYASSSYIGDLLEAGVSVYSYKGGFLHAKVLTIDGTMTMLGSANMDFRSLEHNFEINCCVYDSEFTRRINTGMEKDFDECELLVLRRWRKRPFFRRLWESVMRLFSPLL